MSVETSEQETVSSTVEGEEAEAKDALEEATILGTPDDQCDVILKVEGGQLRGNRTVLASYSSVFHAMFFSEFKEKDSAEVVLKGKSFKDMKLLFDLLLPRKTSPSCNLNDENLPVMLALADEYDIPLVMDRGEDYTGWQCMEYLRHFYNFHTEYKTNPAPKKGNLQGQHLSKQEWLNKCSLYVHVCDKYNLRQHQDRLIALLTSFCKGFQDLSSSGHYSDMSDNLKVRLLELICKRLDA